MTVGVKEMNVVKDGSCRQKDFSQDFTEVGKSDVSVRTQHPFGCKKRNTEWGLFGYFMLKIIQ